jgi:hypothetical protein
MGRRNIPARGNRLRGGAKLRIAVPSSVHRENRLSRCNEAASWA